MGPQVEVMSGMHSWRVTLQADRTTVGQAAENDLALADDPASTRTVADELFISQAAVKQHLVNLYDKFGVAPSDSNRRSRLANEALRRGAVSLTQLRVPGNR